MSFDWNNAAEQSIAGALGLVPEVGSLLAALVYIFWPPSQEDIWSEIEQQVEQLINQKIDQLVYQQVKDDLSGLSGALSDYISAVKTGDNANISAQWIATETIFDAELPHFQSSGYELLLLPLFAQFANLNLSLLRDGVLFGSQWGWNAAYQQSIAQKLTKNVGAFTSYANQTYQNGYSKVVGSTGANNHTCEPFRTVNAFVRQMTLTVNDFSQNWQYFDLSKYPNPVKVYLSREIYSDPVGTADDSGAINLPSPPAQPINQISVWGWDRIDAAQLTYPANGGPGGVTQTSRMGDSGGGSNQPPHGGVFNVSSNPVTVASGLSGSILNAFSFTFHDGRRSNQMGGNYGGGGAFSFSYDGEILSSIHINGISNYYGSADCAVFGFKFPADQPVSLNAVRTLYITNPKEASLQELASKAAASVMPVNEAAAKASSENWNAQRQAYWQSVRSRSKPLRG